MLKKFYSNTVKLTKANLEELKKDYLLFETICYWRLSVIEDYLLICSSLLLCEKMSKKEKDEGESR